MALFQQAQQQAIDGVEELVDRVRVALTDPRWNFRTVQGIARDTGIPAERVVNVLAEHPDIFRQSKLTRNGEQLFTLRDKPESVRERYAELRDFIASPVMYRR